ncbi:MAG TPA: hypothetical protein VGH99_11720 [Pseudonocardia sp.]
MRLPHRQHGHHQPPTNEPRIWPVVLAVAVIYLTALVIGVLGVLIVSR